MPLSYAKPALDYLMNTKAKIAAAKRSTVSTIENRNNILSNPRLEAKTFPSPPKVAPKPVPRCCSNIATIKRIAITMMKG